MKRRFFYFAVSALVLSACTSEDVLDDAVKNSNVITFENVVNKPTRGDVVDLSYDNLKNFSVFGYYITPSPTPGTSTKVAVEIFNNILVKRNDNNIDWSYTDGGARYWVPDATYYFFAYSCGQTEKLGTTYGKFKMNTEEDGIDVDKRVLTINDYLCDYNHQHDLIYATNTGYTATQHDNPPVAFTFNHILSKIQATFTNGFHEGYVVEISDVRLSHIYNTGSYNPNSGWSQAKTRVPENTSPYVYLLDPRTQPAAEIITLDNIDEKTGNSAIVPKTTYSAVVLPHMYTENSTEDAVYLTFNMKVLNKGKEIMSKAMSATLYPNWKPGYSYTYNITVDALAADLDEISFTVSAVEGWKDNDTYNPNLPISK